MNSPIPGIKLIATLLEHEQCVHKPSWSPDGNRLATPDDSGTIRMWDGNSFKAIAELRESHHNPDRIYSVAWNSSSSLLAAAVADNCVRIWDVEQRSRMRLLQPGHASRVHAVAWSMHRPWLASGGRDGVIAIWNANTWERSFDLEGHADWVNTLAWSPIGGVLASGGGDRDRSVRLWDVDAKTELWTISHNHYVAQVAFSPNGQLLASCSKDHVIHVSHVARGEIVTSLYGHSGLVKSVAFDSQGQLLASKSEDGTVRLWRTDTWSVVAEIDEPAAARWPAGLAFHPRTELLATLGEDLEGERDRAVRIWQFDYEELCHNRSKRDWTDKDYDIFLCYNSEDYRSVVAIRNHLIQNGVRPWMDRHDLHPPEAFIDVVERLAPVIPAVAVFVGSAGAGPWQQQEIKLFLHEMIRRQIPIFPIILRSCVNEPQLPQFLRAYTWIDYRIRGASPTRQLAEAIRRVVAVRRYTSK